jgi:hypothetical protein
MLLYFALGVILLVLLSWFLRARMQKKRLPLISNALELMEREYEQKIEILLLDVDYEEEEKEKTIAELSKACYLYIKPTWRQFLHLLRKSPYAIGELSYQPLYFPNLLTSCEGLLANKERASWTKMDEEFLDDALKEGIAADVEIRLLERNV